MSGLNGGHYTTTGRYGPGLPGTMFHRIEAIHVAGKRRYLIWPLVNGFFAGIF